MIKDELASNRNVVIGIIFATKLYEEECNKQKRTEEKNEKI